MPQRIKKILLVAALLCSCLGAFVYWRRYQPLEGTDARFEIREDGKVWKLRRGSESPLENAAVHAVEPPAPYCSYWAAVPAEKGENEGIVLFRSEGRSAAFLPCAQARFVAAVSASPSGRVLALIKDKRGEIEFFALPERTTLGTIFAFGPVLWSSPARGTAFARDGRKITFTMEPQ